MYENDLYYICDTGPCVYLPVPVQGCCCWSGTLDPVAATTGFETDVFRVTGSPNNLFTLLCNNAMSCFMVPSSRARLWTS